MKNSIKFVIVGLFALCVVFMFVFAYNVNSKKAIVLYRQGLEFLEKKDLHNAYYNFSKISCLSNLREIALLRQAQTAYDLGDFKTARLKFKILSYTSSDASLVPYALYYSGLIDLEKKNKKSAYLSFNKIYSKFPNSDFMKASSYQLGKMLIEKNPQLAKKYFIEYLEYAPQGKYSLESISLIEGLNLVLTQEEKFNIANALFVQKEYFRAIDYVKNCDDFKTCLLASKIQNSRGYIHNSAEYLLKSLTQVDKTSKPEDISYVISKYISISPKSDEAKYEELMAITKRNQAFPCVLYEFAKKMPKMAQIKNYETVYSRYPASYWAPQSMWNVFWHNYKSGYTARAKKLARMHITRYENSNSTPAIKFWLAKILMKEKKYRDAKDVFSNVIKNHKNSYYAFISKKIILGKTTPFNVSGKIDKLNVPAEPIRLQKLSKSLLKSDNLNKIVFFEDIDLLEKLRIDDEFIKSYIASKTKKLPYSVFLAQQELEKTLNFPEFGDIKMQLAYPLAYVDLIEKYSKKYEQNPYLILSLIRTESTFDTVAQSSVGASGLMQLLPSTANMFTKPSVDVVSLQNPDLNIKVGVQYFKDLQRMFGGSQMYAVLAYNAGPGNVSNWKAKFQNDDFDEFVEDIPFPETQNYIKRVFGTYWNYINIYENN